MSNRPMEGVRVLEVAQFTFTPAAGAVLAGQAAHALEDRGGQVVEDGVDHGRGVASRPAHRPRKRARPKPRPWRSLWSARF